MADSGRPGQAGPRRVRELPAAPPLTGAYLRAVRQRPGNPDRVPGHVLRLSGVTPDPARVAAYAEVVGDRFGPSLPPLYPHLLGFPLQMALLTDEHSPFPAMGLVHVHNEVVAAAPIPVGAALDVEVEMTPPRPHRKGRTVDLLATVTLAGETVWTSSSTYLRRGKPTSETNEHAQQQPDERPGPGLTSVWRLPADTGRRYAAVSGDRNPIHLSALSARAFGFPRAIAHGMWTAARALGSLEGRLPAAYRAEIEFRAPVTLPGTVEFLSLVGEKETVFELRARNKDRMHLRGAVTPR